MPRRLYQRGGEGSTVQQRRAVSSSSSAPELNPFFAYRSAAISHIIQKSLHKTRRRQRNSQKQLEPGQTTRCGAKMWPNLVGAKQAETQLDSTWLDSSSCHRNYYDYKGRKNRQLKWVFCLFCITSNCNFYWFHVVSKAYIGFYALTLQSQLLCNLKYNLVLIRPCAN